jgi:pyruvate/2-oxoglutarate dehydrogenase complex dihydrolipoamide dehydrogenase (E3) component
MVSTCPNRAVYRGHARFESVQAVRIGLIKVVVDTETIRIWGTAIVGVGGDEAIHSVIDVMVPKTPYTTLQRTMHIHPTASELITTVLVNR